MSSRLTHWGRDKMDAISQTTCSSAFFIENVWIPIEISLKFVPKRSNNNNPAFVQIMAWCRPGDKPLSEPMMIILLTHTCVTRPQWVNTCWQSPLKLFPPMLNCRELPFISTTVIPYHSISIHELQRRCPSYVWPGSPYVTKSVKHNREYPC